MLLNQFTWPEILADAQRMGIPAIKKRGILREFLQTKILYSLYRQPGCPNLIFTGGTSLRLLSGNGRFSEDLDFDNLGLTAKEIFSLLDRVKKDLEKEGLKIEVKEKQTVTGATCEWKFLKILFELRISFDADEKLMIKFDFTKPKENLEREILILSRFGLMQTIITYRMEIILAQKIRALLTRKETKGRDIYDIVWLLSKTIHPFLDLDYFKKLKIKDEKDLYNILWQFVRKNKEKFPQYKKQLQPFLLKEEEIRHLDLFEEIIKSNLKSAKML